jgi:membrane protein DedA with SNARE-associated domain
MHWWRFLAWNAAGGIVWALLVGLVAYRLGDAAAAALNRYGLVAAGGIVVVTGLGYVVVRWIERRTLGDE